MTPPARRVRSLRLRAPDEQRVLRGAVLIEDALRTASVPGGEGSRVMVVRSLDLGTLSAGASPATVAVALERGLQRLASSAVSVESASAETAPAVHFADDAAPFVLLARRLALGIPCDEWYWPLAVPGWSRAVPRDAALRLLLARVVETSTGPAAGVRLVREVVQTGGGEALLSALRPQDGEALLRSFGWRRASPAAAPAPPAGGAPERLLRSGAERWGAEDSRTHWLACALLASPRPTIVADPELPRAAAGWVRRVTATEAPAPAVARPEDAGAERPPRARERPAPPEPPALSRDARPPAEPAGAAEPVRLPRTSAPPPEPTRGAAPSVPPTAPGEARADAIRPPAEGSGPAPETPEEPMETRDAAPVFRTAGEPLPTEHAAFLFLIPLLLRLRVNGLLDERPDLLRGDWAVRLLRRLGRRLGVPPGDPILAALAPPGADPGDDSPEPRELTAAWIRAMRAWPRRHAGIGLATLVRRRGRVTVTPSHVDVFFDQIQVDMRIRRTGLDFDPGWVPWLGRVISFHYLYGEASGE